MSCFAISPKIEQQIDAEWKGGSFVRDFMNAWSGATKRVEVR
jgi:hypothetical protein